MCIHIFCVCTVSPYWRDFEITWHKCSTCRDDMQSATFSHIASRSRSLLKVIRYRKPYLELTLVSNVVRYLFPWTDSDTGLLNFCDTVPYDIWDQYRNQFIGKGALRHLWPASEPAHGKRYLTTLETGSWEKHLSMWYLVLSWEIYLKAFETTTVHYMVPYRNQFMGKGASWLLWRKSISAFDAVLNQFMEKDTSWCLWEKVPLVV